MPVKDTVMSDEQLLAIENKFHLGEDLATYKRLRDYIIDKVIARRQDRISFKAGQKDEKERCFHLWEEMLASEREGIAESRKAGIKEVVEWLRQHPRIIDDLRDVLPVKLKEWEIEIYK